MAKKPIPAFASEEEEARWWFEHQDDLEDYTDLKPRRVDLAAQLGLPPQEQAVRAAREATAALGSKAISIRVANADLNRAKRLATRKGLPYQGLIKMLIHEGLDRLEREAN